MPRKKFGTNVAEPRPFTVFLAPDGSVAVRIGRCKPFARSAEVWISASPVSIVAVAGAVTLAGIGVGRPPGAPLAVTAGPPRTGSWPSARASSRS